MPQSKQLRDMGCVSASWSLGADQHGCTECMHDARAPLLQGVVRGEGLRARASLYMNKP